MYLSDLIGIVLAVAGIWLVVSGLPQVSPTTRGVVRIVGESPVAAKLGLVLLLIGFVVVIGDLQMGPVIGSYRLA